MDKDKLDEIVRLHGLWLNNAEEGVRADLRDASLRGAYLSGANLSGAYLNGADLRGADLSYASLRTASLNGAYLNGADLNGADLRGAYLNGVDLRGADLDYSGWPLWCGSRGVKLDARIAAQLAAHFCVLDCDDPGYIAARDAVMAFAKTSHRAKDLGLLE